LKPVFSIWKHLGRSMLLPGFSGAGDKWSANCLGDQANRAARKGLCYERKNEV
jgi:hypothetical protein